MERERGDKEREREKQRTEVNTKGNMMERRAFFVDPE